MARRIFYARRSKRPFAIAFGLMCLSAGVFYVGFEAGRTHPDLFVSNVISTPVSVVVAER